MRRERAFILIELLAVMVILSLLVGVAHLSLRGVRDRLSFEDVTARVGEYDRSARAMAGRFGVTGALRFEPGGIRLEWASKPRGLQTPAAMALPDGYTLQGPGAVVIGPSGRSRSYTLCVRGPGQQQQWLMVSGLGGRVTQVDDEQQAQDILAMLASPAGYDLPGVDAH